MDSAPKSTVQVKWFVTDFLTASHVIVKRGLLEQNHGGSFISLSILLNFSSAVSRALKREPFNTRVGADDELGKTGKA